MSYKNTNILITLKSQIITIFLAILTLFSSVFIAIDAHFCCGHIVDITLFGKADVCEMDMISCKDENTSILKIKGNCCHNSKVYKSVENFYGDDFVQVDLQQLDFTPNLYSSNVSDLFIESEIHHNYFSYYRPPLITKDILVLVQRFLI